MFGSFDGQPVEGVMVHHQRHGLEGFAELAQDEPVAAGFGALNSHVHKSPGRPANNHN